jgi:head-tail adaptor
MRHRTDVTPGMRLVWLTSKPANKVLNIEAAPPTVGAANSLELVCVEEV